MFALFRRLVSALFLMALGAALWEFRGVWLPTLRGWLIVEAPTRTQPWAPVTTAGAARTKQQIVALGRRAGRDSVTVDAADFAAYLLGASLARVTAANSAPEAIIQDGTLYLRTRIRLAELGGRESLGPLGRMLNESEPLLLAGRLEPVRPGLVQFRVTEVALREIKVPVAGVVRLVQRWGPPTRPSGVAADALPLTLPAGIAEARTEGGRVTLVRSAP